MEQPDGYEEIGIREAARRIGVSDTALRKGIAAGRLRVVAYTPTSNRPLVAWPQVKIDWEQNSNAIKRSHMGSKVNPPAPSAGRKQPRAADPVPMPSPQPAAAPPAQTSQPEQQALVRGPSIAQSNAIKAAYQAQLMKLEYEQKVGNLVNKDEVKVAWFKQIQAAKTRILGIPAACKSRYADLPLPVVALIDQLCREALEDLANERDQ